MQLKALGEEISCRFVMRFLRGSKNTARGFRHGFVPLYKLLDHFLGGGDAFRFHNARKLRVVGIGRRREVTELTNAFGD